MDSNTGGQTSDELRRRTAAEIARKKVLAAYAEKARQDVTTDQAHLKDTPVTPKINSESWKKYHSAWQDYYQKYYSEYYSRAAREYVEKERLKDARAKAEEEEILGKTVRKIEINEIKEDEKAVAEAEAQDTRRRLRLKIRKKATDNARQTRRRRKFIPIVAGLAVVATILFLQYNRLIFAPLAAYVSPGDAPASQIEALDPTVTQVVSDEPRLIIPKINVDVPITFGLQVSDVMEAMNHGVAHYRISGASAYPGELGNFVVTGHSAGDVYSANPYKYIFSGLERLETGDLIYVNYKAVRYTYRVTKKEVIEPTNVGALVVQTEQPIITLVTCTPLGTSRYRLLVTAEQISPEWEEFDGEAEADQATPVVDQAETLPTNEPSFFERIWNFFTGQ